MGFQILIEELGAERLEREILPKAFRGTPYLDLLDPARYDASGRKMGEPPELRRIKWMFNHFMSQAFKREKLDEMFCEYLGGGYAEEKYAREWFMSGVELCEMAAAGMEIASHTATHPPFDVSGVGDIRVECAGSLQRLREAVLGATICSFGWPFGGEFRPTAREVVSDFYESGWNFHSKLTEMPENPYADLMDIPRLNEQVFLPA